MEFPDIVMIDLLHTSDRITFLGDTSVESWPVVDVPLDVLGVSAFEAFIGRSHSAHIELTFGSAGSGIARLSPHENELSNQARGTNEDHICATSVRLKGPPEQTGASLRDGVALGTLAHLHPAPHEEAEPLPADPGRRARASALARSSTSRSTRPSPRSTGCPNTWAP
jgi:hypothetical protein